MNYNITLLGQTNFRNKNQSFGMKQADRLLHTYIIGKTGVGKSTLMKNMLLQDVASGRGACLIDPHGDLVEDIYHRIPAHRKKNVMYLDCTDPSIPFRYNPLKRVSLEKRALVTSGILEVFERLWGDAWGVKLEHILRFSIIALLDQQKATLADIPRLLLDKSFRYSVIQHIACKEVKLFWQKEFPAYTRNDILPVLNKVGAFLVHPVVRRIFIENKEEISLRKVIDSNTIFLVNLSKGVIGTDTANIIGSLLVTAIGSASFSRADISEEGRKPFIVYLDEFQNFTTLSLINMLSELRKYKVGLVLAHQYINQLHKDIRNAIFGNIGSIISFRLGIDDAKIISQELYSKLSFEDFLNLSNYSIYLKIMIDGIPSKPFSAYTHPPYTF